MHFAPYTPEHRPFFVALFTDAGTMAHVGGPMTPEAAGALFDAILAGTRPRVAHAWLVIEPEGPAGHAALLRMDDGALELGVVLAPHARGRGLGTAAARAVVERARALGLPRVLATVDLDNHASRRMCENAGLSLLRRFTDDHGEALLYGADL